MNYKALVDIRGAFNNVVIREGRKFDIKRIEYHEGVPYVITTVGGADIFATLSLDVLSHRDIVEQGIFNDDKL